MRHSVVTLLLVSWLLPGCSDADPTPKDLAAADVEREATWDGAPFLQDGIPADGTGDLSTDLGMETMTDGVPAEVDGTADVPTDAEWGNPCASPDDCSSGLCIETGAGGVCTDSCIEDCPEGWECKGVPLFGGDLTFVCVPEYWVICSPCEGDDDCKADAGVCVDLDPDGLSCTVPCEDDEDCPGGFVCGAGAVCLPASGSCSCRDVDDVGLELECMMANDQGSCPGIRGCQGPAGWGDCLGPEPALEACDGEDNNCDGVVDEGYDDLDLDGVKDCVDDDDDGDTVVDTEDNCPLTANPEQMDMDGDAAGDLCDDDADGDGFISDQDCEDLDPSVHPQMQEACNLVDDNCNGLIDEGFTDTDQDSLADCIDEDDDNDGEPDEGDNCPLTSNSGQEDLDEDGIGDLCDGDVDGDEIANDADNCGVVPNPLQENADGDSLGDACDLDDDNDGVPDETDNCSFMPNPQQENLDGDLEGDVCDPDDDNDTVGDAADNCPSLSNLDQADLDGDGKGDLCDEDDDEDGVPDLTDNCPIVSNPLQDDHDDDGLGDLCDLDDDNDGVDDEADNCPLEPNTTQDNCDADALGDACDPDDDNDGTQDETDCGECDASIYPGAPEACNGLDDNCNGFTDELTEPECHPYICAGAQGCLTACAAQENCVEGHFCDLNDVDGNGATDECVPALAAGAGCTEAFECVDAYCGNGHCCGAPGELCCADSADCAPLDTVPVCDAPAACTGHRLDGQCNSAKVCKAQQIADHSGCAGALCFPGKYCVGAMVHEDRFCGGSGSCSQDGPPVQNCQGSNPCCNYGCSNGACGSAFNGTLECAYLCFLQPLMCFCF
ncbi:MAG: thrombospondin type 3 repeat-containing protein [Pseudomonadota bacterium]